MKMLMLKNWQRIKIFVGLRSALNTNGIQEVWENAFSDVLLSEKGDNTKQIVLQHVLQHCWTVLLDNICFERKVADESSTGCSRKGLAV